MKKKKNKTKEEQRSCDHCKGDGRGGECSQRSYDRWALGEGGEGLGQPGRGRRGRGGKEGRGGKGGWVGGGLGKGGGGGPAGRPFWARRALHSGPIRPVIPRPVIWARQARPA